MARGETEGARPVWEEWILAESKRRYGYIMLNPRPVQKTPNNHPQ